MKSSARKIQVSGFEDLFGKSSDFVDDGSRVQELPLTELHAFKNHPYQIRDDEAMEKMGKQET